MIYLSVCSRKNKEPKELALLKKYCSNDPNKEMELRVSYDAPSFYQGHKDNLDFFKDTNLVKRSDIFVFLHDDIEILSSHEDFKLYLKMAHRPAVGFVGVAGAYRLGEDAIWWNSRQYDNARGFVFQGDNKITMKPNYFGNQGEVVVLDGCLIACAGNTLEICPFEKPGYLTSDWDFYDIGITMDAHMKGLRNFTVPIITRHVSSGQMRDEWYGAREQFISNYKIYLPRSLALSKEATNGLPG